MIGFRIEGGLCHDGPWTGSLEDQRRSIGLMSDEMDCATLYDMEAGDGIPLMKQMLPLSKAHYLNSEVMQVIEQREHDRDHVPRWQTMASRPRSMEAIMRHATFALALLFPAFATAQSMPERHSDGMTMAPLTTTSSVPTQAGQGAFAAIQEIIAILEADPNTDWRKIDIEALRLHLIDMDNVALHAEAMEEATVDGMTFTISGDGAVRDSIRRMVKAHAATMNGVEGWQFSTAVIPNGAQLTVLVPVADVARLRGLGFIGVLASGMHHQMHHLMLARGEDPHDQ